MRGGAGQEECVEFDGGDTKPNPPPVLLQPSIHTLTHTHSLCFTHTHTYTHSAVMASDAMEMNGVADRLREDGEGPRRRMARPLNMNNYANKKSAAESMLDVALLMANASQLKAVLEQGPTFSFYSALITLISISLILQVIVGVLLIFIVKWNLNDESKHYHLNILENISTALVFIIVVVNVFITAFGVQRPHTSA